MDTNSIVQILQSALDSWNKNLSSIMGLLTTSPANFNGGGIWGMMVDVNGALQSIAMGLLVLFFVADLSKQLTSLTELKRPEVAVKAFVRYAVAQYLVTHGMELMTAIFSIAVGIISTVTRSIVGADGLTVPAELVQKINAVDFLGFTTLWPVALLLSVGIQVCAIIILITVYSRFFKLFMYTALSPIAMSAFAGQGTSRHAMSFLKSYAGVCLEGVIIAIGCIVYTAFATAPVLDPTADALAMIWKYVTGVGINMIILIASIKGADVIISKMTGL